MQISGVCTLRDFDMAGHPEMTLQGQIPSCYQPIFPQPQNTEKMPSKYFLQISRILLLINNTYNIVIYHPSG